MWELLQIGRPAQQCTGRSLVKVGGTYVARAIGQYRTKPLKLGEGVETGWRAPHVGEGTVRLLSKGESDRITQRFGGSNPPPVTMNATAEMQWRSPSSDLLGFRHSADPSIQGALSSELRRELSCGFANIACRNRGQATFRAVLPRACPVSLSSWARRAFESGSTVSTTGFSFLASTSFAISDNCEELGWAEKKAERTPFLAASPDEGGATIETRIPPFFDTFHERF